MTQIPKQDDTLIDDGKRPVRSWFLFFDALKSFITLFSTANTWTALQTFSLPPVLPTYTVATVPSAATYARGLIYVSNETGGATVAFSDGTNWRRVQDLAIVS